MSKFDPQLLELSEIIPIMDDLFNTNEELASLLNINWKFFNKEDKDKNKIFKITTEVTQSISNILRYVKKVDNLKQKYYKKIKSGNINNDTVSDFKILNNKFHGLMNSYMLSLQSFRIELKSINMLPEEEKIEIDKSLFGNLYEIMDIENNIINLVTLALENNISSGGGKEEIKLSHTCEIKKDNQIFIDNDFSGITLTNSLSRILKKLIKLDKNNDYPKITTKDFMASFGDDAFRTSLKLLREETDSLFNIKNTKNEKGEGCYYLEFFD